MKQTHFLPARFFATFAVFIAMLFSLAVASCSVFDAEDEATPAPAAETEQTADASAQADSDGVATVRFSAAMDGQTGARMATPSEVTTSDLVYTISYYKGSDQTNTQTQNIDNLSTATLLLSVGTWNFTLFAYTSAAYRTAENAAYTGTCLNQNIAAGDNALTFTLARSETGGGYWLG